MRIERDRLIYLALATCAEQVELAHAGPPAPSHGVKLALSVLHCMGNGDRKPFDDFWKQMRSDEVVSGSEGIASYCRTTHLQTQLRVVMRAVGIEPCVATEQPLQDAALRVYPRGHSPETRL